MTDGREKDDDSPPPGDEREGETPRRPPSVRDALGPATPRPAAPRPVRPLRSAREADPRDADAGEEEKRPTPVRAAMGVARGQAPPVEVPTRTLRVGEGEGSAAWVVREEGRTATGHPPDPGAPLLFLTFATEDEPESRVREVLAVGRSIEAFTEAELEALLERARPLSPKTEPEEIFPGTRRSRGDRRR